MEEITIKGMILFMKNEKDLKKYQIRTDLIVDVFDEDAFILHD